MRIARHCLAALALLACAISAGNASAPKDKDELRVLFIGNSLTYANDLPAIVEALARASGQKRFVHQSVAFPDFSLQDHWEKGDAQRAIKRGRWNVVILQQGPSGLEESRRSLLDYTRRFAQEIRAAGATPALYMVWPSQARIRDFDRVEESYKLAAAEVQGNLLPVGAAWREAWKSDPKLALYSEDKFHPSVAGSYLAALVIYERLYGATPIGLPASLKLRSQIATRIELAKEQARLLQLSASDANKRFRHANEGR